MRVFLVKRGGRLTVPVRCVCNHRERDHGEARVDLDLSEHTRCRVCTCPSFRDVREVERKVATYVELRDGGCLLRDAHRRRLPSFDVPPCFGSLTPHHLRKDGQGGDYTPDNIVCLCVLHNGWVEDQPNTAEALGLVVRREVTHAVAAARREACGIAPNPNPTPGGGHHGRLQEL